MESDEKSQVEKVMKNIAVDRGLAAEGTNNQSTDGNDRGLSTDSPAVLDKQNAASSAPEEVLDEFVVESEISKLSLIQLKKYYKWRISGVDFSEALIKAKEFGLKPLTNDPHPDCKLSWAEINQISLLIPARHIRSKFQIDTYFGGKDPEEHLKRTLSISKERHPNCKQTWEDLIKMASELPKVSLKLKFVVETFYEGEKPKELLKTMLSTDPVRKLSAAKEKGKDSAEKRIFRSARDKIPDESPKSDISKLSFEQMKKYHRLVVGPSRALEKIKVLSPQTEEPRPSTSSQDSICRSAYYDDPTTIEGGTAIRNMDNGKLKCYCQWRNAGFDDKHALSKANDLEECPGEHSPHPKCKKSYEKLKKMTASLVDRVARERFLILTYYGGKDPECTMKYFTKRSGKPEDPEDVWYSFDKHLEAVEKIGMGNGKLKYYYLWMNKGYNHKEALSRVAEQEKIGGEHKKHPDCKYSREELMKSSQALKSDTHTMARFIIHTFFGGKDPESTLKYFTSRSLKSDEPEDILAEESVVADRIYEPLELIKKSNGNLKFYYLWRNEGFDHKTALSKVAKLEKFPGTHLKHPNCKHTRYQLTKISRGLKSDVHLQERFLVMTCFGGFDPEATLKYLKSGSRQENESDDEDETSSTRSDVLDSYNDPIAVEDGPIRNLVNKKLKYYYLWRNSGYDLQRALKRACNSLIPRQQSPHPVCSSSPEELRKMSQALSSDVIARDRFLIHTYFGGKDPVRTLTYFTSRSGKVDEAKGVLPENFSTGNDSFGDATSRSDKIAQEKFLIHTYFGGKPRSEREPKPTDMYADRFSSENDSEGEGCDSSESHPSRKLEDYLKKGLPFPIALAKVKKQANKSFDLRKPRSALPLPFERTKSCSKYAGIIPLDSPNHPYNQLDINQLKNYYLWINQGCSHEEAMIKAKTPKLFPACVRSTSLVSLERLKTMSKRLPNERLIKIFIIETYYAGADPEEVMDLLLSKGHCISASSQKLSSMIGKMKKSKPQLPSELIPQGTGEPKTDIVLSPKATTNEDRGELKGHARFGSEDSLDNPSVIEEEHTNHLSNGLLQCYYLWGIKVGPELALVKVNNRENFPGSHFPHPNCKYSKVQLEEMSQTLLPDISACNRFFIHTYYGGKDPECTMRYFLGFKESSNTALHNHHHHQQQQQQQQLNPCSLVESPSVPLPYRLPAAGMPIVPHSYQQPCTSLGHAVIPPHQYQDAGSPFAAYPDYRPPVADQTALYTNQHLQIAGVMGSMPYPPYRPSASALPTVPYPLDQPEAPITFSGFPHAIGPSAMAYQHNQLQGMLPFQQQTPPFVNSASISSHAQSILSKRGESMVGEDDQLQSSLKRKMTNEFPIKIKFKSTSEERKPLKKVRIDEKLDQIDSPLTMYIVSAGFPKEYLTETQMNAIERNMLEAILEMDDDGTKPIFKDPSRSNGRYGITCIDQFSISWLYKFLSTYQPWPGASLKLISSLDTKIRANVVLPPCKEDDDEIILRYIAKQNKELNVSKWTVMERWDGDFNTSMDLVIDEESAKVLQKCSRIGFKLGIAEVVVAKSDGPPFSRFDDRDNSRSGSPKRTSTSRPSPPVRSSSPRKRSNKTDKSLASSSRSSERSRRKHDGSPQMSSTVWSPSRDRFGRSVSRTHSSRSSSSSSSRSFERSRRTHGGSSHKSSTFRSPSQDRFGRLVSRTHSSRSTSSSPPKRYRKADASLASSSWSSGCSRRTHECPPPYGSPRKSSPVWSPSQDRFARSGSKTRSSRALSRDSGSRTSCPNSPYGQKPFHSGEGSRNKNKRSASRSTSRDRNFSPIESYRKNRCSRKPRRRSHSSSSQSSNDHSSSRYWKTESRQKAEYSRYH